MFASEKNKLIAAGLALTLFGGVVGAYTTRTKTPTSETTAPTTATAPLVTPAPQPPLPETQPLTTATTQNPNGQPTVLQLPPGQAYQLTPVDGTQVTQTSTAATPRQTSSRQSSRTSARTSSAQRTYYTYEEAPKKRSFWNRHGRDILTIGAGTGLGAAIGGIAGGKKGAGIGALAGGGGAALYTYGIRKRN